MKILIFSSAVGSSVYYHQVGQIKVCRLLSQVDS